MFAANFYGWDVPPFGGAVEGASKKRGRPSMGKRGTFKFRVTESLRDKFLEQSKRDGRSVSEIIESELEISFARRKADELIGAHLTDNQQLARDVLLSAEVVALYVGHWKSSAEARQALLAAVSELVSPSTPDQRQQKRLIAIIGERRGKGRAELSPELLGQSIGRAIAVKYAMGALFEGANK
jgi:hypothetical protein